MQKKIIALAIAAAFSAPAFADASLYGIVDAAVASVSADGLKGGMVALSGGAATSRVGLNAAEDLSGGTKIVVNLEYGLDAQQSDGIGAARQEILALAGDFGTVATGYAQTTGYDWEKKFDPLAGSAVSTLQAMNKTMLVGTIAGAARAPRALAYISPNMGGFSFAINYSTALNGTLGLGNIPAASTSSFEKSTAYLLSGTYSDGPIAAGLVVAKLTGGNNGTAAQSDVSDMAAGVSYNMGVATVYGTYQTSKVTPATGSETTDKAMSVSVTAPVGSGIVGFQFANHKSDADAAGASGFTLGYLQPLSKTALAYVAYQSVKNDSNTAAYTADNSALGGLVTNGGSSSVIALGLKKSF